MIPSRDPPFEIHHSAKAVYDSMILPTFTYCGVAPSGVLQLKLTSTQAKRLTSFHDRCLKIINGNSKASSTRIRIFLKTHLFLSVFKKIRVHTRSVFENIPVHTKTLLHSNFAVRTSTKENRQSKCPFVVPKDPCACSNTS